MLVGVDDVVGVLSTTSLGSCPGHVHVQLTASNWNCQEARRGFLETDAETGGDHLSIIDLSLYRVKDEHV